MADFNVSAIAEHAWNAWHGVDWNWVTILEPTQRFTPQTCAGGIPHPEAAPPTEQKQGFTSSRLRPLAKTLDHFQLWDLFSFPHFLHLYFFKFAVL